MHKPGPRSVPVGIVGTPAQASALSGALDRQAPGGFTVASYPTQAAARNAITGRSVDAAVMPGRRVQLLLVATAAGPPVTDAVGSALPAVQNTVYFNGNAITAPLLVLAAWALAGAIALALVAVFHPPIPGQRTHSPDQSRRCYR